MINWKPYPKAPGEYAEELGLVLSAYNDGSWQVWMPVPKEDHEAILNGKRPQTKRIPSRTSADLWPNSTSTTIQEAKQAAEAAFNEMING